jgi:hypothetical protein
VEHAGSGTISGDQFEQFLCELEPPLGLSVGASNAQLFKMAASLDIPMVNGRIPFLRVLYELVRIKAYHPLPEGAASYQLDRCIKKHFGKKVCADQLRKQVIKCSHGVEQLWQSYLVQQAGLNAASKRDSVPFSLLLASLF